MAIRDDRGIQKVCALQRGLKPSAHAPPGARWRAPTGTRDLLVMPRLARLKSERFRLDAVSETSGYDTSHCDSAIVISRSGES